MSTKSPSMTTTKAGGVNPDPNFCSLSINLNDRFGL